MKNLINKLTLLSLMVFVGFGCDNGFEELNENPNEPAEVSSGLLMADALFRAGNRMHTTFVGGDMGACWAQQFSKVQYNDEARYTPRGSVIQAVWDDMYEDLASDARTMYNLAGEAGNTNMQGVARVMEAYAFQVLTDVFGSVPYTEALQADAGILKPVYDDQATVYAGVLALLDEAETLFATGEGEIGSTGGTSDLVYQGDASKWRKFANSLKFRALMRISSAPGMNVGSDLQALVNKGNMFTSNDDDAAVHYLGSNPNANPLYETVVFGTRLEWKVSDVLVNTLSANNDPRLAIYVAENDAGEFRGKPSGIIDVPSDDYSYANVSGIGEAYLNPELPGWFMTYSELNFLMAEAAQRGLITGDAQTFFQAGIDASLTSSTNGLPAGSYSETLAAGTELQQIGTQKWIALFGQGVEAWNEWRRTRFPVLTPAIEGALGGNFAVRYTYPSGEQTLNATNYSAGVASLGGPDRLDTNVWWDVNGNVN
jgi:hypothetical protein